MNEVLLLLRLSLILTALRLASPFLAPANDPVAAPSPASEPVTAPASDHITGSMEWGRQIKATKARGSVDVVVYGNEFTKFTEASLDNIFFSATADSKEGAQFNKKKGEFKAGLEDINDDGFIDIKGEVKVKRLVKFGGVIPDSDNVFASFA